ncbi:MAG: metallophosphoesterase [Tannerella sp.]|jgi:hypothetical protein|nr:metallophosphoesterase [Tannerella sp.]
MSTTREILIVPDIHGRNFWRPALDYPGSIVFLGDYTDPYPSEGTHEEALRIMRQLVELKKRNPERITLLTGNHEFHYCDTRYRCGRFSLEMYELYHQLLTGEDTAGCFQLCRQIDRYLFIHAGITKYWYDRYKTRMASLGTTLEEQVNRLFREAPHAFFEVSFHRGGMNHYGSPLWADVNEYGEEPEPFDKEIIQIVGHTQIRRPDPVFIKNVRMLDNCQLYLLKEDKIEKYRG